MAFQHEQQMFLQKAYPMLKLTRRDKFAYSTLLTSAKYPIRPKRVSTLVLKKMKNRGVAQIWYPHSSEFGMSNPYSKRFGVGKLFECSSLTLGQK